MVLSGTQLKPRLLRFYYQHFRRCSPSVVFPSTYGETTTKNDLYKVPTQDKILQFQIYKNAFGAFLLPEKRIHIIY